MFWAKRQTRTYKATLKHVRMETYRLTLGPEVGGALDLGLPPGFADRRL